MCESDSDSFGLETEAVSGLIWRLATMTPSEKPTSLTGCTGIKRLDHPIRRT